MTVFSNIPIPFPAMAILAIGFGVLTGCQTASVEDLAPSVATADPIVHPSNTIPVPSAPPAQTVAAVEPVEAPINTGEYPKIGHIPVAETAQLGPSGTAAIRSNLAQARASQNTGAAGPETYTEKMRRLLRLGQLHGKETLAEIEAK